MRLRARGSQEAAKKRCSEEGGPRQVAAARERGEERGPGKFVIGAKDSRNIRGCGVNGRANEGAGNILMYHLSHPLPSRSFSNLSNFIFVTPTSNLSSLSRTKRRRGRSRSSIEISEKRNWIVFVISLVCDYDILSEEMYIYTGVFRNDD